MNIRNVLRKKNCNDEIIKKFCELRNKSFDRKNSKYKSEYLRYKELCLQEYDYLIKKRVQKYKQFSNYEDLYQEGRIALLAALNSYSYEKGDFNWWANKYIKTKLSREANKHSTIKIPIKKTATMQPHKVSHIPVMVDIAPSALDEIIQKEIKDEVIEALNRLSEKHRTIIELSGIKSHSITQISKELNITKKDCVKLLNEAKERLKNYLGYDA